MLLIRRVARRERRLALPLRRRRRRLRAALVGAGGEARARGLAPFGGGACRRPAHGVQPPPRQPLLLASGDGRRGGREGDLSRGLHARRVGMEQPRAARIVAHQAELEVEGRRAAVHAASGAPAIAARAAEAARPTEADAAALCG